MQDSSSLYEGDVTVECDDVIDAIGVSVDGPLAVTYMAAAGISTEEDPWPPAAARTVDIEITIRASCCRFVWCVCMCVCMCVVILALGAHPFMHKHSSLHLSLSLSTSTSLS